MSSSKHILILALPAWGHVRPLLALAVRLVVEREDIIVTALIAPSVLEKAHADVAEQFRGKPSLAHAQARIRIVSTFKTDEVNIFHLVKPFAESFPPFYQALVQSQPITCTVKGTTFDAVPPPSVAIMDFFATPQLMTMRAITGRTVPVSAFISGFAGSVIRTFGPERYGGLGELGAKIDAEVARTGRPADEVGEEIFDYTDGSVVEVPGLPAMYDHEYFPQQLIFNAPIAPLKLLGCAFFRECDAAIVQTFGAFENSGSLTALRSWFSEGNQGSYAIGPLLPLGYGEEETSSRGDEGVEVFLGDMLKQYGERSVLFFSFGTIFWPSDNSYVIEAIETLIEKKFPFIFCYASPFAQIPDELVSKVKASGIGYMSKWAPQQYILSHPATGWFLTHGGHGSVTESLANGVPLICWPFEADQPTAAAHLTENLKVAFELVQVRSGKRGLLPMLRHGQAAKGTREAVSAEIHEVIDACRGEKGAELKRNAQLLKAEYAKAWGQGGSGRTELEAFLTKYL